MPGHYRHIQPQSIPPAQLFYVRLALKTFHQHLASVVGYSLKGLLHVPTNARDEFLRGLRRGDAEIGNRKNKY